MQLIRLTDRGFGILIFGVMVYIAFPFCKLHATILRIFAVRIFWQNSVVPYHTSQTKKLITQFMAQ